MTDGFSSLTTSAAGTGDAPAGTGPAGTGFASTALASRGLTKRYGSGQLAVDGIDLTVPAGSVYGFLGPNGSGKTTTIRMLLGLIRPTAGTHEVLGMPMPDAQAEALPLVGSLVEGPAFYPHLTGRGNLARFDGRLTGSACSPPPTRSTRHTRSA
jgi:ABC-2 type transport system ATP-binding protein